jgi:endonuclease/exonuclease/phosphatase family metal-dependent hydrolase
MMRHFRNWPVWLALLPIVFVLVFLTGCPRLDLGEEQSAPAGSYLFCFWNVENLFDDHFNHRLNEADKPYDEWFAEDAEARTLKYRHLSEVLLKMNQGRGPDILAVAEVESLRAAELLRTELNDRLPDERLHYAEPLFEEVNSGRHIAPAILLRKEFKASRTHLLNKKLRALETHLALNDHELILIISHWTSRVSDGEGIGREKYAKLIYGRYRAIAHENPKVDLFVAGDFNDPPDAPSVMRYLHAHGDRDSVLAGRAEPELFNLMADKSAVPFGTIYHKQLAIFDQIAISPGLLDEKGWTCDPESVKTVNNLTADLHGHPLSFGNHHHGDRGYSDHFPVTVRLQVEQ